MASNYPGSFDSFPTITADKLMSDTVGGRAHRGMHNDMGDVIEAMQAELGLNPSGQAATVAARLDNQTVVNVKDYGAAGNDTTDDTTAIQNALSAGAGKTVYVPPGTYKITDYLTVSANTLVTGPGTIHQTGTGKAGLKINGSGVTIDGITLKGRHASATYNAGENAIDATGAVGSPLTDVVIRDVTATRWGYDGIWLQHVTGFGVTACVITDCGYSGVAVLSSFSGEIRGNRIDNISPGSGGNNYGVSITHGGGDASVSPASAHIITDGNTISNVGWNPIDTHGGTNLVISNNVVLGNSQAGIAVVSAASDRVARDITITGNVIDGMSESAPPAGTKAIAVAGYGYANADEFSYGIVISNNILRRTGNMQFYNTRGMVISGNTLDRINPYGMLFYDKNTSMAVVGNTCCDLWSDTNGNGGFITEAGTETTGTVTGNVLLRGSKSATYVNRFGIKTMGTGASLTLGMNDFWVAQFDPISNMADVKTGFFPVYGGAPVTQPTVTGAKGGNAALTSLCTALANRGLITNSTS